MVRRRLAGEGEAVEHLYGLMEGRESIDFTVNHQHGKGDPEDHLAVVVFQPLGGRLVQAVYELP